MLSRTVWSTSRITAGGLSWKSPLCSIAAETLLSDKTEGNLSIADLYTLMELA